MLDGIFNKKFLIATLAALAIIIFWDTFFLKDLREAEKTNIKQTQQQEKASTVKTNNVTTYISSEESSKLPRVQIKNPVLTGSIALQGARLDDIFLLHYKESLDKNSRNIKIFDFSNTEKAYFFESGWVSTSNLITPTSKTIWKSNGGILTPTSSVVLYWTNPQGIVFKKELSIDENYVISVKDIIENKTSQLFVLSPFALILRHGEPNVADLFISHEGFVGYVDKTLERVDYKDTKEKKYEYNGYSSYLGFTDKYWLSAILLENKNNINSRFLSFKDNQNTINYQADYKGQELKLEPNQTIANITKIFVGPKEYGQISSYEKKLNIEKFDDTLDFGWFFFFTKPMIMFLLWIYHSVGSFGVAMLIFTIIVRIVILPIAYKSYVSMAKMRELQPKMKDLKDRYGSDMQKYNKELMSLYKKEQVNPLSGCLPIILQIPIFFSIYKVIFISIELRQAPFWGWVHDMSAMDPSNVFNLFGLLPFDPPSFLHIGVWPILMGVTMFIQQKISTTQALEGMQQKIMNLMPIILTFILASFPAGLVIYWTWSNIISIVQQFFINKKVQADILKAKSKKSSPKVLKKVSKK